MPPARDPFFQVPRANARTSAGNVELPILYYDASALYAFFLVDQRRIANVMLDAELDPCMRVGDKAIVGVACYQYRDTSVGVYNEVGLAVAVQRRGETLALGGWRDVLGSFTQPEQRHSGLYVLDLPVTTPMANAAGREIWGFPKFVTPIQYRKKGRAFACQVDDCQGEALLSLQGKLGLSLPAAPFSLTLYSHCNQTLLRTTVNARGQTFLSLPGSLQLQAGTQEHVLSWHLHELGLDGARPVAVMWTDQFQSRLNAGVVVKDYRALPQGAANVIAMPN